ncbi:MAG TPA: type II toxin-antitoxin system RelE/ParE family toxin [Candidatus Limnocylindria bacterium]|nr:type II toxin-antitoxin system RelE/ParE family toxin [Candidatus Limnocylindria bacterium]
MSEKRYRVELAPAAQRQLARLPPGVTAELRAPILALGIEPRPSSTSKVSGTDFWRLRAGAFRIVHAIDDSAALVVVVRVARRSESTYRRVC